MSRKKGLFLVFVLALIGLMLIMLGKKRRAKEDQAATLAPPAETPEEAEPLQTAS